MPLKFYYALSWLPRILIVTCVSLEYLSAEGNVSSLLTHPEIDTRRKSVQNVHYIFSEKPSIGFRLEHAEIEFARSTAEKTSPNLLSDRVSMLRIYSDAVRMTRSAWEVGIPVRRRRLAGVILPFHRSTPVSYRRELLTCTHRLSLAAYEL